MQHPACRNAIDTCHESYHPKPDAAEHRDTLSKPTAHDAQATLPESMDTIRPTSAFARSRTIPTTYPSWERLFWNDPRVMPQISQDVPPPVPPWLDTAW